MYKINHSTLAAIAVMLFGAAATFALAMEADPASTSIKTPAKNSDATSLSGEVKDPGKTVPTDPVWTRIAPGEFHMFDMVVNGWTVFSLDAASEESVLAVYIYDEQWNTLAEFDSTGCGAFLQIEPQLVNIVIHNKSRRTANQYILNVYDVN